MQTTYLRRGAKLDISRPLVDEARNRERAAQRSAVTCCVVCGRKALYYVRTRSVFTGLCAAHKHAKRNNE